jgi:hypothetical protein
MMLFPFVEWSPGMSTEDVAGLSEATLGELIAQLATARENGHIVVPVIDSAISEENLQIRFARIPLPDKDANSGEARSYIPVFTSAEELLESGMPSDTQCVQPSPEDLIAVLGPDEWIAINPGQRMIGLKMEAFLRLWNQLPQSAERELPAMD